MNVNKLVSIITPCYNGESFAAGFFETILSQTYPNIELIFINDGSTDKTEKIALEYRKRLEDKGYRFTYIYQDNAGQAAAVNKGLKLFNGEYMMWTDSDDLLHPENVAKKVDFLDKHPEYDFVMCRGQSVREGKPDVKLEDLKRIVPQGEDNLFKDLLIEKNVVFTPGVYMVRREAFIKVNPQRSIIESCVGQNWQLLLPLSYSCRCGYIKDELFYYVVRDDSHSRKEKTLTQVLDKLKRHNDLLNQILDEMKDHGKMTDGEYNKYKEVLDKKYIRKQFDSAYHYHDKKLLTEKYKSLNTKNAITRRDTLIYMAGRYKAVDLCYSLFKRIKRYRRSKL